MFLQTMIRRVGGIFAAEMTKVWRTRFPYLGLAASALTALIARQFVESWGAPGETTAATYLQASLNMCSTMVAPIFITIFASMLVASETSRGTLRMILPRPITRADFLTGKLLSGLFYMAVLFAVHLAVALPIALQYPLRAAMDEGAPGFPSDMEQLGLLVTSLFFTLLPHAATVCFGFLVSVLSGNVATAIGVAVGVLLSFIPMGVKIQMGTFKLGDWIFSSYYDTAIGIAGNKAGGVYQTWQQDDIYLLVTTSLLSCALFTGIGYAWFIKRDMNV